MPCNACNTSRRPQRKHLEPELLPTWEVALLISVHERTVRRLVRRGQLAYEVLNSERGDYRLKRPAQGEKWIHPEGTFPAPPLPPHLSRRRRGYCPTEREGLGAGADGR